MAEADVPQIVVDYGGFYVKLQLPIGLVAERTYQAKRGWKRAGLGRAPVGAWWDVFRNLRLEGKAAQRVSLLLETRLPRTASMTPGKPRFHTEQC